MKAAIEPESVPQTDVNVGFPALRLAGPTVPIDRREVVEEDAADERDHREVPRRVAAERIDDLLARTADSDGIVGERVAQRAAVVVVASAVRHRVRLLIGVT
ncbi:hypothetical protein [Halobellus sp. GM3]|uniref:hypothetical protein n=1 Tax=Halobellus sp. GM3 TaxID=3458410 RepID=UPI00403DBB5B